ncbi:MAG: toprim domain-containing protein, partial [Candidatus Kerfeldbacteria bacterium]|nr:toprim domain-containing protein [Candidatus Kerfeldbacteria bacterium]
DRAKHAIRKSGVAILMEGQMDVIAAHQFGFTNVIAASGTALTDAQVKLLKRYAKQAIFAFDVDQAGVEAARRAIAIARRFELDVRIATMPHGKDPDECIREDKDAFQHAITSAAPAMEFFMQLATNNLDRTDVEAKKRAAKMVLPEIAMLTNPVEQAHYIQRLGFDVGVDEKTLHDAVKKVRVARPRVAAPSTTTGSPIAIEEYILAAFFLHPELIGTYMPTFDSNALSETMRDLYTQMVSLYSSGHKDSASFQPALESLSDQHEVLDRLRFLSDELRENFSESELSLELHEWIATRSRAMLQRELANLQTQIRQLEGSPSDNQSTQLQALTERYASRLARLKQFES